MKLIEWTSDETRQVPALRRTLSKGDIVEAPDNHADSLVSQGVAKFVTSAPIAAADTEPAHEALASGE